MATFWEAFLKALATGSAGALVVALVSIIKHIAGR
jgi:hypothetical protein